MQYTENYNLNKPELTDVADITKISDNMDIIDEELEKRTTKLGFLTDLITHLASDAAIAISSLSTDSVFYRLLQYALNAAGVQYNFTNSSAWYICLGALFGGLIIQGGIVDAVANELVPKSLSISLTKNYGVLLTAQNSTTTTNTIVITQGFCDNNNINVVVQRSCALSWLVAGY